MMIRGKNAILAVPFEEEDLSASDLLVAFFKKSLAYLEIDLIGTILAPGVTKRGEIQNRLEVMTRAYDLGRKSVSGSIEPLHGAEEITRYHGEMLNLEPDVPGARMWAVSLRNTMLTYFELDPSTTFPSHTHESEQITMVLEGELYVDNGSRELRVSAGEVVTIPSLAPHSVRSGRKKTRAIDAWSPVRKEYLIPGE